MISEDFTIDSEKLECVRLYKYLGIIISACGKFGEARKSLYNKALKAAFKLYKNVKCANPPITTLLHLFDHTIKPILLYGSENWGSLTLSAKQSRSDLFEIFKDWEMEKLNIKFCKYILGVNKRSTNIAILSELGRYPMYFSVIINSFLYWHRLQSQPSDLLKCAYQEYTDLHENKNIKTWYSTIIMISKKLNIDLNKYKNVSAYMFKKQLKNNLKQEFLSFWQKQKELGRHTGKLTTYFKIKEHFGLESYLKTKNFSYRQILTKFRISAHPLRIESGRYERKKNNSGKLILLDREERVCQYCTKNVIEDEFHFLMECPLYIANREHFMTEIEKSNKNFKFLSKENKFSWLLINENEKIITLLSQFLLKCFNIRKEWKP